MKTKRKSKVRKVLRQSPIDVDAIKIERGIPIPRRLVKSKANSLREKMKKMKLDGSFFIPVTDINKSKIMTYLSAQARLANVRVTIRSVKEKGRGYGLRTFRLRKQR